jgi:hypothetical protein
MISIHALTGIHSRSTKTMHASVLVGIATLTTLLDSSSTQNFLDTAMTDRVGIVFQSNINIKVTVANGGRVTSPGHCQNLFINIAGEAFNITCYNLALGSFDMVLGV